MRAAAAGLVFTLGLLAAGWLLGGAWGLIGATCLLVITGRRR